MASIDRAADRARAARAARRDPATLGIGTTYETHEIDRPGLPPAVVIEMPHTHSALVEVFVRAGSAYETPEQNGISHFLEHVVLAGTEHYPSRMELQREIDATGGFLDAVTHKELTEFSFQIHPDELETALELLAESLVRASFSEDGVESERQIVLEEMLTGNYEGAKDPFTEILWGTESVGLPIIGTAEVVRRLTPDDLRAFWRRTYAATNMLVCATGRVKAAEVEAALEAFRGIPSGERVAPGPAPPRKQERPEFFFERYGTGSIDACLMVRTPGWDSSDRKLHTILYLVTQHYQTRVYEELIGPELPVYYLYAGQETFVREGYVYFYFNVSRDRFFPTLDRVTQEIDRMRAEGISPRELEVTKRRYALSVLSNLDDPRDVSYRVGSDLLLCGREGAVSIEEELRQIDSVTTEDVRRVLGELFRPSQLCVVSRGALGWWGQRKLRKRLGHWLDPKGT